MASSSASSGAGAGEPGPGASDLLRTVPRGIAQVDLQTNLWTGLVFIVALFVGGWQFGVFGLLGTVVATLTALALGVSWRDNVSLGLEGFCGTLIGVSLVLYLNVRWMTVVLVIFGAIAGSVLTAALNVLLKPYRLPTLTAPFCVITTVMVVGGPSFARVWDRHAGTAPPSAADPGTALGWGELWQGTFSGVGQVFFQNQWYVGVIFLIGLCVAGWRTGLVALVSSLVGLLTGWVLGAQAADLGAGLYGYNSVLTGIALCGTFVSVTRLSALYALVGVVAAAGLTAGIGNLFAVVGGHTLTWPFVLVTWVFLAAVPMYARIARA
ncbi:urea transporter [Actinocorallia sp. A-T 12471]|uniref:urea transporter n=1 Tax=Actinocorallia sp. A-T 12471 TaxID=3089813 RepID=UPI0029CBE707|nr:urea transporter [Actinocorallia sp. A-T 12471]MDX6740437.1 urea transporter [Actinocorallia sp. A-T 12471]